MAETERNENYVVEMLGITKDIDKSPKEKDAEPKDDPCCDDPERSSVTKEQSAIGVRVSQRFHRQQ